jgi:hypothetical protein
MNSRKNTFYAVLIGLLVVGGLAPAVMGPLPTLTAAGIADGFTLTTTFATTNPGNTGCCSGPFGVAVASTANIIVNTGAGTRNVFSLTQMDRRWEALYSQCLPAHSFRPTPQLVANPMEAMVRGISCNSTQTEP